MDFSLELGKEILIRTPRVLRSMLSDMPDEWTSGNEGPGTWSGYQVLGHLTHIEESDWIDRTKVIREHGVDRVFEPIDREAGFTRFTGWTNGELLDRFESVRAANLDTLDSLVRAEDLARRGRHPELR